MAGRLLLHPGRWTLRAKLTAALISLLAVVCLFVGVATTLSLRAFLVQRLDDQVTQAGGRAVGVDRQYDGDRSGPSDEEEGANFLIAPGQATGTLGARVVDGTVEAAGILADTTPRPTIDPLDADEAAALVQVEADDRVHTVTVGELGSYRIAASTSPDGDILLTGLPLAGVNATVYRLVAAEVAVALAALLAAGLAGLVIVRRSLRPLDRVAATATRVTSMPLHEGEVAITERVPDVDPRTEVGKVAAALNHLLSHVDEAFAARYASESRVRAFVADASHELRTPLASIRGYAELTRRNPSEVSADVAYAMSRVEAEAKRMGVLVDELLLLARLDSGRPLELGEVDLTRRVLDAVSDASATSRDHQFRLDLPDEPVTVLGDADRLHQVLVNLLTNARVHTPAGTTVTARLAVAGDRAELTVHDDGPGISPELVPKVFARFARGDSSRSRAAGSTGLGLAIVDAVVRAHHGEVLVTSEPGSTAFVVRLPLAADDVLQPTLARA